MAFRSKSQLLLKDWTFTPYLLLPQCIMIRDPRDGFQRELYGWTDVTLSLGVQQQRTKWISRKSLQGTSPALGHSRPGKVTAFSSLESSSDFFTFLGKPLGRSGKKYQKSSYFRTRKIPSGKKVLQPPTLPLFSLILTILSCAHPLIKGV